MIIIVISQVGTKPQCQGHVALVKMLETESNSLTRIFLVLQVTTRGAQIGI